MCEGGKRYKPCTSPCAQTCKTIGSIIPKYCKTTNCMEGCACPDGMVDQDGECVPQQFCPCYYNGQTYNNGSIIAKEDCKIWYFFKINISISMKLMT